MQRSNKPGKVKKHLGGALFFIITIIIIIMLVLPKKLDYQLLYGGYVKETEESK